VLIKGQRGYVLMVHAGHDAVVTILLKANARLGLIFLDVKRAADSISKII
jgi:predicted regulator of Ras-like GTPase activity (Roadblock/LC7/MglB family)